MTEQQHIEQLREQIAPNVPVRRSDPAVPKGNAAVTWDRDLIDNPAKSKPEGLVIPEIRNTTNYVSALHELGHIATDLPRNYKVRLLPNEDRRAWQMSELLLYLGDIGGARDAVAGPDIIESEAAASWWAYEVSLPRARDEVLKQGVEKSLASYTANNDRYARPQNIGPAYRNLTEAYKARFGPLPEFYTYGGENGSSRPERVRVIWP